MFYLEKNNNLPPSATNQTRELAGIEILRFLCALAIIIWHYQNFFFPVDPDGTQLLPDRSVQPFYGLLQYAYEGGFWAVEVFWTISGFIFYWTYAQPIFDRRVGFIEFAIRRFSRLYPLHASTLIIVALTQHVYFDLHGHYFIYQNNSFYTFIEHLFFASNWLKGQAWSFNGPIWSVSVEILIYFAFFAVVRKAGPRPVIAVAACSLSWVLAQVNFNYVIPIDSAVLKCALMFFAGGFALWLSRQRFGLLSAVCVGALTGILLLFGLIHVGSSIILVLAICSVTVFVRLGELKSGSVLTRLAFLGNATYSSYLMHFPIQLGMVMIVDSMGYSRTIFLMPVMFLTYLVLVVAISLAVYRLFELPAQKRIRDISGRLRRAQASLAKS